MPTKKKRVGFIPREDVMKIIDKLSVENNLSNSKIISILVEEALSIRGMFNKQNGKATELYLEISNNLRGISADSANFKDNEQFKINTKIENHKTFCTKTNIKHSNQDDFDLRNYKMFLSFLRFQEMMDKYNN